MSSSSDRKYRAMMERYGSPFGGGKIERPQERDRQQTTGCGDPNCPTCNPETAGRGLSRPDVPAPSVDPVTIETMRRAFYAIDDRTYLGAAVNRSAPAQPRPNPRLREAVKDLIVETKQTVQWDDVVGNHAAREALLQAVEAATTHKDLYEFYGMKPTRGVLLYGPPGCGKTMFAKAAGARLAELYGGAAEMICMSSAAIQSPFVGVTEKKIRAVFEYAREYRRCYGRDLVVFIDECDVLFPNRQGRRTANWEDSQIAAMLEGMDGIEGCGAFVILATNLPERLDPALLRDGRVDRKIKITRPSREDAAEIIARALVTSPIAEGETAAGLAAFAAHELWSPALVLSTAQAVKAIVKGGQADVDVEQFSIDFCLSDALSGAMAAGVVSKARAVAFARDLAAGGRTGIGPADIAEAVATTHRENVDIEHTYAIREFFARQVEHLKTMAKAEIRGTAGSTIN